MNRILPCLVIASTSALLCLTACGEKSPAPSAPATSAAAPAGSGAAQPAQPAPQPAAPKALTSDELGEKTGSLYVGSIEAVTKLLASKPDAAAALPKVKELKEQTIQKLVELGRLREAMNAADRANVDRGIQSALMACAREPWYATYGELSTHYFKDQDMQRTLASFNIIGQYANFDLLKSQEPDEATRLGIK